MNDNDMWTDEDFVGLFDGGPEHDWSITAHQNPEDVATALPTYKKEFYDKLKEQRASGIAPPLQYIDPGTYKPENCSGNAQKTIVGLHLLAIKKWDAYHECENPLDQDTPPTYLVKVNGNPGSGKSFTICTTRNITRNYKKSMSSDMATAPTGCAADLIHGETHCRAYKIPVQKDKIRQAPTNLDIKDITEKIAFYSKYKSLFQCVMDEDSMVGRTTFAWISHRIEEGRQGAYDMAVQKDETPPYTHELSRRPFGGVPVVYSYGDCHQLPPVGEIALDSKNEPRDATSADASGKFSFNRFLHPEPGTNAIGVSVIMDKVIHQRDPVFHGLIQAMRNGDLTHQQADILLDRCMKKLPFEERKKFEHEALYVMHTWRKTIPTIKKYLTTIGNPVARCDIIYETKAGAKNHAMKDINLPEKLPLCIGSKVMLIVNQVIEEGLMNGSVGTIKEIVYDDPAGPRGPRGFKTHPKYVIVDFPESSISQPLIPNMPATYIPIVPVTLQCEKKCCKAHQIPL